MKYLITLNVFVKHFLWGLTNETRTYKNITLKKYISIATSCWSPGFAKLSCLHSIHKILSLKITVRNK